MTKSKLRRLLTKPKFRAWLEGHSPGEVVGSGCSAAGCPMAKFSARCIGRDVDNIYIFLYESQPIPMWGQAFAREADKGGHGNITAAHALRILDGIK